MSVPLRFGSLTVRFHHFPVRFLHCRFGSITVRFHHGSVPPLSGSVSAMPVRFHYGSVLVCPVRRFPVRFRGHPEKTPGRMKWNWVYHIATIVAHIPWIIYPMRSLSNLHDLLMFVGSPLAKPYGFIARRKVISSSSATCHRTPSAREPGHNHRSFEVHVSSVQRYCSLMIVCYVHICLYM